jgi:hypothetical protein
MRKKRNKIERFEEIDGNRIVWYWGSCPWRDLKILKRNKTYLVKRVGGGIYLVKEVFKKDIYLNEREVLICLDTGTVYLEKLGCNENVFFTRGLDALLDGAIAVEVWTGKEWKLIPVPKDKKEKQLEEEEEEVIS